MDVEVAVKEWLDCETQIKEVNDKLKSLRMLKREKGESLDRALNEAGQVGCTIKVREGSIRRVTTKQQQPLTLRYIEACLNSCIDDESAIESIMNVIKDNREMKETSGYKMFMSKK